mmetsp:Transcript_25268/g.42914  ORF Transcript_25268/g.42914 Transcript_25268/m.42914 type:complete len:102 (+) Transcript_25268:902-1207(+)
MSLIASAGVSAAFAGRPSAKKGMEETICRRSGSLVSVSSLMGLYRDGFVSLGDRPNELHSCGRKPNMANKKQMILPLKQLIVGRSILNTDAYSDNPAPAAT